MTELDRNTFIETLSYISATMRLFPIHHLVGVLNNIMNLMFSAKVTLLWINRFIIYTLCWTNRLIKDTLLQLFGVGFGTDDTNVQQGIRDACKLLHNNSPFKSII